jgi:hypothetical protein
VNLQTLLPFLIFALLGWVIYRRIRRTIGRQLIEPRRMYLRAGILTVLGAFIMLGSANSVTAMSAMAGGVVAGCALAFVGLRHTQFEATANARYYTPHMYIGLFVSLLLIGRLLYRYLQLMQHPASMVAPDPNAMATLQKSPMTIAIFGIVVGYYVFYILGVLRKSRTIALTPDVPA